jgi:hypothetical protein
MIQLLTVRIDKLEDTVQANGSTIGIINKIFWIALAAGTTAATGMLLMQ